MYLYRMIYFLKYNFNVDVIIVANVFTTKVESSFDPFEDESKMPSLEAMIRSG